MSGASTSDLHLAPLEIRDAFTRNRVDYNDRVLVGTWLERRHPRAFFPSVRDALPHLLRGTSDTDTVPSCRSSKCRSNSASRSRRR
jgi:hypothetical protein